MGRTLPNGDELQGQSTAHSARSLAHLCPHEPELRLRHTGGFAPLLRPQCQLHTYVQPTGWGALASETAYIYRASPTRPPPLRRTRCRLYTVVPYLVRFIDSLTNVYVRYNRKRLKGAKGAEDCALALASLFDVLLTVCKVMAPFTPFFTGERRAAARW